MRRAVSRAGDTTLTHDALALRPTEDILGRVYPSRQITTRATLTALAATGIGFYAAACATHHSATQDSPAVIAALVTDTFPANTLATHDDSVPERERMVRDVLQSIAGRETLPAREVFKNVSTSLKDVPAGRFVVIMDKGYSRALGVSCAHCHVTTQWDSEDKDQKQIAREMARMDSAVIAGYLSKIQNLKSKQPIINCTTCHRGSPKPALNLH